MKPQLPLFPATIAGSLPKPSWLAEPEKLWAPWRLSGAELLSGKRDAALMWLKLQEDAGLDILTDGEQFRVHFVHGFLERIKGIDWQKKTPMGIRNNRYTVEVPTVTGKLERGGSIHSDEVRFTRAHTGRGLKVTLPGPMTICDTIADAHYGSRPAMAMAFAEVLNAEARELAALGVDVVQFDEPAFNVFMSEVKDWGIADWAARLPSTSATAMASTRIRAGSRRSAANGASTRRSFRRSTAAGSSRSRSRHKDPRSRCP
jgi:5-methyltetrahydropteroyltriglutamate--homocysteine methyltransferase